MNNSTLTKTTLLTFAAFFAALTAICSWISIPLPFTSVPVNLATFSVMLSGAVLGRKYASSSILVFLLLGTAGLPVFHNFTGGIGILAGPTGGFLLGYVLLAFIVGSAVDFKKPLIPAMILGSALLYIIGSVWFIFTVGSNIQTAFILCVLPFIPGDVVKIFLAYFIYNRLMKSHVIQ